MKKFISLTLVLAMLLIALVGCGGKPQETQPEISLPVEETTEPMVEETQPSESEADGNSMKALIDAIYAAHAPVELMLDTLPNEYMPVETVMESITYYTGLADGSKISEIAISEPMMGQAYSLVAIKVANADDAAAVAQEMYDNIDQRKWICVEADTKVAAYCGDTVIFFMVNSDFADQVTTESIVEAYKTVAGGEVTVIG